MTEHLDTAKLKLVTVIGSDSLSETLASTLRELGATGYTTARAEGWGAHGQSRFGLVQWGNVRVDALVSHEVARKILARITVLSTSERVIAFMTDAEAVPSAHFG